MGVIAGAFVIILRSTVLRRRAVHGFDVVLLIAFLVSIQFGLYALMSRFQQYPFEDARVWIYRATLIPQYVNHAHNDWLELWLEAGLPFAILAGLVTAWLLRCGWHVWRRDWVSSGSIILVQTAFLAIVVALLHAAVDYNLRPLANEAVFALLVALLVRGASGMGAPAADADRVAGVHAG